MRLFSICSITLGLLAASSAFVIPPTTPTSPLALRAGAMDGPPPELLAPPDLYAKAATLGAAKGDSSSSKIFKLAMMSGVHIGFGAYLALTIGGACPGLAASNPGLQKLIFGAFGLPFGLMLTLATGGELFTGNTLLLTSALREGKTTLSKLRKSWITSYFGNLVGSLLLAYLVFTTKTLAGAAAPVAIASSKCSMTLLTAFTRGILCNYLVCLAVYMAAGCTSLASKMVAIWFPISAFVSMGLDHSVANMFIIPLGMMMGAEVTVGEFVAKNLIPVTLGNIVGGAGFVAMAYGSAFGKKKKVSE